MDEFVYTEVEHILDQTPLPLTLAQRMGLVDAPPSLLNEHSWGEVKQSSNLRRDSTLPCPICQEGFQLSTQVRIYIVSAPDFTLTGSER